jgi:hypothetical protein
MLVDERMEHINKIQFKLKAPSKPPTIEFDQGIGAWYLRFRNAKIVKTISEDKPGFIAAIDLDANNEVVGLELIGPMEFSLKWLKKASPVDVSKIDFDRATWVSAASREFAAA